MDNGINAGNCFVEIGILLKVTNLDKLELVLVLWSRIDHLLAFCEGSRGSPHA